MTARLRYDETPKLDRQGLGLLLSVAVAAWIVEKDPFGVQEVQGKRGSMVKVPPWQRPSSAPVPPQGAPGGTGTARHSQEEASPLSA